MARLTRSRSVLDCKGPASSMATAPPHMDCVVFGDWEDSSATEITIPRRKWLDMGAPGQVTVTVEPGNTLDGRLGG